MPFTFAHPALVLPLAYVPKKYVCMTGLIVGSLIPDFEYFLRMRIYSEYSHNFWGVLWFDIPLGLAVAWLFHTMVRNALIDHLPTFLHQRFINFKAFDWREYFKKHYLIVVLSLFIGAWSHIIWDSFTHPDGYMVLHWSTLQDKVNIFGFNPTLYKILQHSSTLLGFSIIALFVLKLPKSTVLNYKVNLKYWIIWLSIVVLITSIRVLSGLDYHLYGHVIVTLIAAGLWALVLTPLVLHKLHWQQSGS